MTGVLRFAARWWPVAVIVAGWQLWITLGHVPPIVAPSPVGVVAELIGHPDVYVTDTAVTIAVAAAGLLIGGAVAAALAVAAWFSPFATGALSVPAIIVQATPIVAILPVLARVLGYDQRTVVAAAALITLFPTFVLVASGLRALPSGANDVFAALGAGRFARLRLLAIPSAVPNVLVALRIAAANCILAALVAEYLMGTSGLGRLFASASGSFQTERAWGAALVATILSVTGYLASRRFEQFAGERYRR